MAKAQSVFGGTNPKNTGKDSTNRQVGHSSAGSVNTSRQLRDSGASAPPTVSPLRSSGGKGNNSQQVRDGKFATSPLGRPNVKGKVDNRKVGQ